MDNEIAKLIAMVIGLIGLPSVVGSFILGFKNLKIKEKQMEGELKYRAQELELTARTLSVREKEAEIDAQRLSTEIRALDNKHERKQLE
jgi:hypothetical protein